MAEVLDGFIVIEGLDGAGTTTQSRLLADRISALGRGVDLTAEPTGDLIGSFIRENILKGKIEVDARTLLYLYLADRNEHIFSKSGILNSIECGKLVICDRYIYSTMAYQGLGVSIDFIRSSCASFPLPKLLVFIDTPVDVCIKRIESRSNTREIFEKKDILERIRLNYTSAFENMDKRVVFLHIDGVLSVSEISNRIMDAVEKYVF